MHASTTLNRTSFSALLARYMQGQIGESAWRKLMTVFDAEGVTSRERMAFARFINEMLAERETIFSNIPSSDEVTGLLTAIRASQSTEVSRP